MRWAGLLLLGLVVGLFSLLARPVAGFLSGRVERAGEPVPGVPVRLKGGAVLATSDASGGFALPSAVRGKRVTAWQAGHFIAGATASTPLTRLRLQPLPAEDHAEYDWVDPTPHKSDQTRCGNCHGEIYREWKESGHSRSVTGPHFLRAYADLLRDRPDGAGVCASCHAPALRDDDPAAFDLRKITGVARHGVHCDYCHKVSGPGDGEYGLTHGRFQLRLLRPREGQLFFGPLDDVDRGEDAYSPFYRDSRYCAACHEGVVFGVHVYSTYSEWRDSPAAKAGLHCQHCHMQPTGEMTNLAPGRGGIDRDPMSLGNHSFWAGSQMQMLRQSLRLSVTVEGRQVTSRLVAEGVGHRVPTGFLDRQLLLLVEAKSGDGRDLRLRQGSTLPDAAGPGLAGRPGRLYARLLKDEQGRGPMPFWRGHGEPVDTRLSPGVADERGFVFESPPARVRVRVLYRRFWASLSSDKEDTDRVVIDRSLDLLPPTR